MAEELVQDIFVKLWLTRETLVQIESFRSFLLIICRNHAFNAIKKMVREKNREWEWSQGSIQRAEEDLHQQEALLLLIDEAVEHLPPRQQKAWILCRRNGLKYDQAAHEMQVSKDAIKKYLQYANAAIKKYVSGKLAHLPSIISVFSKIYSAEPISPFSSSCCLSVYNNN